VAVRAHHVALGDLFDERLPAAVTQTLGDVERLVAEMVELEHDRIRLAAVDTRMAGEVLDEERGPFGRKSVRRRTAASM
jgi:hypothetical protein